MAVVYSRMRKLLLSVASVLLCCALTGGMPAHAAPGGANSVAIYFLCNGEAPVGDGTYIPYGLFQVKGTLTGLSTSAEYRFDLPLTSLQDLKPTSAGVLNVSGDYEMYYYPNLNVTPYKVGDSITWDVWSEGANQQQVLGATTTVLQGSGGACDQEPDPAPSSAPTPSPTPTPTPAPTITVPTASCAKILFIGVRGSGQPATQDDGYGNVIDVVRDGFLSNLPSSVDYQSVAVDYPAAAVPLPPGDLLPSGWNGYFSSINQGISALQGLLDNSARNCTGAHAQKWVLAGYSQGALIINEVVRNYPASHFGQIDLIADPARVPNQVGVQNGSAQPGSGVATVVQKSGPLPAKLAGVTSSLCDYGDIICDFSHVQTSIGAAYGIKVHTSYPSRDYSTLYWMGKQAVSGTGYGNAPNPPPVLSGGPIQGAFTGGSILQSTVTGYAPNETVQIVLESTPQVLGTVRADAHGVLRYRLKVPQSLEAGQHHLVFVSGTGTVSRKFQVKGHSAGAQGGVGEGVAVAVSATARASTAQASTVSSSQALGGRDLGLDAMLALGGVAVAAMAGGAVLVARRRNARHPSPR